MKAIQKIVIILTIIVMILIVFSSSIYAFEVGDFSGTPINNKELDNAGNKIITVISTIGSVVSVIVLVVIGIKYMIGSVEEKAEYKRTLMPYVIGAGLVFAASAIAGAIYNMVK